MIRTSLAPVALALPLVALTLLAFPAPAPAQPQMMMPGGQGGQKAAKLPQACRDVMAMRDSMRAQQATADAKLNDLVAKMNAASGAEKVDAIAAVVSTMVAQRQAQHEQMASMHTKMQAAMASCPMMRKGGGGPMVAPAPEPE
jgi:hypothetical protein